MQNSNFDLNGFNIIQDEENFYFFRALNNGDSADIERGLTTDQDGNCIKIRTDRERWLENSNELPRYGEPTELTLEEIFDHIKMHNRKDTNCISLSSNANVSITYGRSNYKDKYVLIRVPKIEFGNKVVNAGEYMLAEIEKRIEEYISNLDKSDLEVTKILSKIQEIDNANTSEELSEIIRKRYTSNQDIKFNNKGMSTKITYSAPVSRITSWQALDEQQVLEKNRLVAKIAILEQSRLDFPTIIKLVSNRLLIQTVGNAFSSMEQIHYGNIDNDSIINVSKEVVDIFSLIQQLPKDFEYVEELKMNLIKAIEKDGLIDTFKDNFKDYQLGNEFSIDEIYKLTEGKIAYKDAEDTIKKVFYLAKGKLYAHGLLDCLKQITDNNPKYEKIFEYIEKNGFEIEPEIITRNSNKGYQISETVNLDFKGKKVTLIDEIKKLSVPELIDILENNEKEEVRKNILSKISDNTTTISIEEYYCDAIISSIDWNSIGISAFSEIQKKEFIAKLVKENVKEIYLKLQNAGIDKKLIPTYILNIVTNRELKEKVNSENYLNVINENLELLEKKISITQIETFLDYYKIDGTEIQLRNYQQEAVNNIDEIFTTKDFASVLLPTGAGKSFVALTEMLKHQNEPMLYLAPQNEIIEQMKDNILHYVLGKKDSLDRDGDIQNAFPNLKFETYPGLKAKRASGILKDKYKFVVLDELHRTGAKEWEKYVDKIIENQDDAKILGITATPTRDVDDRNMADETARKLGFTEEEIEKRMHIAKELDLQTAIQLGLVVNPKIISFIYKLNDNLIELSNRINELGEGRERQALQTEYNMIEKEYYKTRKYVSEADGISDILKNNLKKTGRYIVFVPVGENGEYEDEDGNKVGKKTSKDKIEEYRKKVEEYLKDSGITPKFYSMLGEYPDKKNREELNAFEEENSEETKFLIVMNKANEGLHINRLDGIIWFRDIDDDSRILISQQLGRVIYSEDPNNPTKEEDRPIVIDACNNILKLLNERKRRNPQKSDLLLLDEIINWVEIHNQIPNVESSNTQEVKLASILYRIQKSYNKYLNTPKLLENLDENKKKEIQMILEKGSEIDLWGIHLKAKETSKKENNDFDLFEVESFITDLVMFQEKVEYVSNKTMVEKFLDIARILKNNGVDLSKIQTQYTYEGKSKYVLLNEIKQEGIDIEKIISENNLDGKYNWGGRLARLRQAYYGSVTDTPMTEEQKKEAKELGLILEKEKSVVAQTIEVAKILNANGVDIRKQSFSKTVNKKTVYILLKEVKQEGIDIEKIIRENGLDENFDWGYKVKCLRQSYNGNNTNPITEEEKREAEKLGLIPAKKKTVIEQALEICHILKENGVDFSKIQRVKKYYDGSKYTVLKDIKQEGIDIQKIIEENGLDPNYAIGEKLIVMKMAYNGGKSPKITPEQRKEMEELGVTAPTEKQQKEAGVIAKTLDIVKILIDEGFVFNEKTKLSTVKDGEFLLKNLYQEGIDMSQIIRKHGLDENFPIGYRITFIRQTYKGYSNGLISEEEKRTAEKFGLIPQNEKSVVAETLGIVKILMANGIDVNKIKLTNTVKGKTSPILLKEIKQDGIDIDKIISENGLDPEFKFGYRMGLLKQAFKGTSAVLITDDEKKEIKELGLMSETKTVAQEALEIAKILKANGVDLSQIKLTKTKDDKNRCHILLKEITQEGIDIQRIIEENNLNPDFPLGSCVTRIRQAYLAKNIKTGITKCGIAITQKEMKEAKKLGIIVEKEKSVVEQVLEVARILKENNVRFDEIPTSQNHRDLLLEDIKNDGIDIRKIIEENGLDPKFKWGNRIKRIRKAYKGTGDEVSLTEDQKKEIEELGLLEQLNNVKLSNADKKGYIKQTLKIAKILQKYGVNLSRVEVGKTVSEGKYSLVKLDEIGENGINIEKIIQENGLDPKFPWGKNVKLIRREFEKSSGSLLEETEKREALSLGLIMERSISKTLEISRILVSNGIDLSKLSLSKCLNGKQVKILLKEIQQDGVDVEKIIQENGLDPEYKFGERVTNLRRSFAGSSHGIEITEEEREEALQLGLITEKVLSLERAKRIRDEAKELNNKTRAKESELDKETKSYEE